MDGDKKPKCDYVVEYVADPDVSTFETDFDQQPEPRVAFHVFGTDSCPSCKHSTSGVFPLAFVATTSNDSLTGKVGTAVRGAGTAVLGTDAS